jgi:hypothetical protein
MALGPAFKNKPAGGSQIVFRSDGSDVVFARLVAMLRASPALNGCAIRAWDDPSVDQTPPSEDGPPWVRLSPMPGNSRIKARTPRGIVHEMPLVVEIEAASQGLVVANSQKLWGSILGAIFPTPNLDAQLTALGVSKITVLKAAWAAPMDGSPRCFAKGSIELLMYFTTTE